MHDIYLESDEEMREFLEIEPDLKNNIEMLVESLTFHKLVSARDAAVAQLYHQRLVEALSLEELLKFQKEEDKVSGHYDKFFPKRDEE